MHKIGKATVLGLLALSLVLASCAGYTEMGAKTSSHQGMSGGDVTAEISKANGTAERDIEVTGTADLVMEVLGEDDQVTLALEARDGETVSGHGQMVPDSFGEASYRVTALEAEDVAYSLEYTFR